MRDWRAHWREVEAQTSGSVNDSLRQVGKTVMGEPVSPEQLDMILATITQRLELESADVVLDLGCGNGLLTSQVADRVKRVIGVDISETLIETARSINARYNCDYHVGDLAVLGELPMKKVNKAFSYEVFQHLSEDEVYGLLRGLLGQFRSGLVLFAGSLPERSKLRAFYNTPERWARYEKNLAAGVEQVGHWWEREELIDLCSTLGLCCTPSEQKVSLYTSHYRFDAMISAQ